MVKSFHQFNSIWTIRILDFGDQEQGTIVNFSFAYSGDPNDLFGVQGTCGCQNVKLDKEKGLVYGSWNVLNSLEQNQKQINIYANDGKDELQPFVLNKDNVIKMNPKIKTTLTLKANVIEKSKEQILEQNNK